MALPKIDLPIFGTELEIAQIVIEPKVSEEENQRIIDQLNLFREDILEGGMSFASKALLYSQDPGSRSKGGKYTLNRKKPRMAKEFRDVAFSLREDEISQPFKTEFGWHILAVDKIRGQEIDIRHILLIPKISADELKSAKEKIDNLRERISNNEITFSDASDFTRERLLCDNIRVGNTRNSLIIDLSTLLLFAFLIWEAAASNKSAVLFPCPEASWTPPAILTDT